MPRMGEFIVDEKQLASELESFRRRVINWAKSHDAWHDAWFHVPFVHRNERPRAEEVLLMTFEGPLHGLFNGGWNDGAEEAAFLDIVKQHGLWSELYDHCTMSFGFEDKGRALAHLRRQRWEWVQRLMAVRLSDIRDEIFEHFADVPDDMKRIGWRQFEELLDAIFKNQGFRTELGPGRNDGGIDLRLYQNDAIPELVSLVQAKRYATAPIQLEAVAALFGVAVAERAESGMFVTTSRFQPKARSFALGTEKRIDVPTITLVDGQRVAEWCGAIARDLSDYFSMGVVPPHILTATATDLTGRIVVAHAGYGISYNRFCVIEADFPHEVILRSIGSRPVSGDGQVGEEVADPNKDGSSFVESRFVAFKKLGPGETTFWGDRNLFALWDGKPRHFNYMD
jgi:hypothetical protein